MEGLWTSSGYDTIYKEEYDRKMSVLDLSTLSIFKSIDKRLLTLPFRLRQGRAEAKNGSIEAYQSAMYARAKGSIDDRTLTALSVYRNVSLHHDHVHTT